MVRRFVPVVLRRVSVIVLGVMTSVLSAGVAHAQDAAKANPYVFAGDGAVLLNFIKADHVADFEMILGKLKDALNKSEKPERKQQAASWKVFCAKGASKPRASEKSICAARKMLALGSIMRRAASVGTMPGPERTKSGSPAKSRRRLSDALTAGWCMPKRMAALETLRSVSTVCRTLIR